MPNWVQCRIVAMNENVDFSKFTDADGNFTFERVLPMPKDIYRGNLGEEERKRYGSKNWYDWSIEHWSTKWDCREPYINGNRVEFETAWSFPEGAMKALAKKVGTIFCIFADEDIGSNCGGCFIKRVGSIIEIDASTLFAEIVWHGALPDTVDDIECAFGWRLEE